MAITWRITERGRRGGDQDEREGAHAGDGWDGRTQRGGQERGQEPGAHPDGDGQVEQAEGVPGKGQGSCASQAAMEREGDQGGGEADEDVAPAGGQGEVARELAKGVQDDEDDAEHAVELNRGDRGERGGGDGLANLARQEERRRGGHERADHEDRDRAAWR